MTLLVLSCAFANRLVDRIKTGSHSTFDEFNHHNQSWKAKLDSKGKEILASELPFCSHLDEITRNL
jgi:hypothetical protein